jgi:glutathione S-transferase
VDDLWRSRHVPALEVDGLVLTQSLAIIEWLDETWAEPPLLPADKDLRVSDGT